MLLLSLLAALIRVGRHRTLRWFTGVLMGFFQNTPLLVQVFFLYNVLPLLGVKLPVFAVGASRFPFTPPPLARRSSRPPSTACPKDRRKRPIPKDLDSSPR
ncbi:MAG: ABC transporter permease subunit [Sphaerochaeta sp.]|nr:ABC transporter permease subunit [Sphaerochaeta sp.]